MDNIYTVTQAGFQLWQNTLGFAHKKSFIYFVGRDKEKIARGY